VQPIAVLSATKLPGLESFPLANATVPGYEVVAGFGLVGKKGLEPGARDAMAAAITTALANESLTLRLRDMAIFVRPGGPDVHRSTLTRDAEFWGKVVRASGMTPN
jgi:tripartite-type tricarboxylate transporter receptor subunit TctC